MEKYIHQTLQSLEDLGIHVLEKEKEVTDSILGMPKNMLEDMDKGNIVGLIFDYLGVGDYDFERNSWNPSSEDVYSFDMEFFDISTMYTHFLRGVMQIAKGDIDITDIKEDLSQIDFEKGSGFHIVYFKCNSIPYEYQAKTDHDWFDCHMVSFMNQILREQNIEKSLFMASDGWQNCILFYNTEQWAKRLKETTDILQLQCP